MDIVKASRDGGFLRLAPKAGGGNQSDAEQSAASQVASVATTQNARTESPYLFVTERGGPISEATVRKMVARAGQEARIDLPVHPHMLRRVTGSYLANNGVDTRTIQAFLGHRNIMHTVRYVQLAPDRFARFGGIEAAGVVDAPLKPGCRNAPKDAGCAAVT